jgi:hypothetical protein
MDEFEIILYSYDNKEIQNENKYTQTESFNDNNEFNFNPINIFLLGINVGFILFYLVKKR